MARPRYGVMRVFKTKREAEAYVRKCKKDRYGVSFSGVRSKVAGGYAVRRTDYRVN